MEIIPALKTGTLVVVYGPQAAREEPSVIAAQLALRGEVTVLDGGNRFQAYRVAHLIRRHTPDVSAAVNRLFIRRAFTCYQMLAILENTPSLKQPHLILDLLGTFYDDHVPTYEARNLSRQYKSLLKEAGLPSIRFHDLRHTAASLMLNHGIPVLIVSKRLGHAKPSITLDIYGHLIPSMQEQVAQLMDEVVTPIELEQVAPGCTTQYQNNQDELKSPPIYR